MSGQSKFVSLIFTAPVVPVDAWPPAVPIPCRYFDVTPTLGKRQAFAGQLLRHAKRHIPLPWQQH